MEALRVRQTGAIGSDGSVYPVAGMLHPPEHAHAWTSAKLPAPRASAERGACNSQPPSAATSHSWRSGATARSSRQSSAIPCAIPVCAGVRRATSQPQAPRRSPPPGARTTPPAPTAPPPRHRAAPPYRAAAPPPTQRRVAAPWCLNRSRRAAPRRRPLRATAAPPQRPPPPPPSY